MSRTDKDAPYWVRTEFYEPDHDWTCPDRIARSWQQYHRTPNSCTLPKDPVRVSPQWLGTRTMPEIPDCKWIATWPADRGRSLGPRSRDRHWYWWGPDRAGVRNVLTKARQQYNGSGDVDIVEPTVNPRHAMFSGGWWD